LLWPAHALPQQPGLAEAVEGEPDTVGMGGCAQLPLQERGQILDAPRAVAVLEHDRGRRVEAVGAVPLEVVDEHFARQFRQHQPFGAPRRLHAVQPRRSSFAGPLKGAGVRSRGIGPALLAGMARLPCACTPEAYQRPRPGARIKIDIPAKYLHGIPSRSTLTPDSVDSVERGVAMALAWLVSGNGRS